MSYVVERDEQGDDVLVYVEGTCELPKTYRDKEIQIAVSNLMVGHDRRELAISRQTLHEAVQKYREVRGVNGPAWTHSLRDPRRFSSTPVAAGSAK